jgi:ABC-2 type transport system permease protein
VVAHLIRLKLVLLRNSLRRGAAAIVGMVVGVLYGGGLVLTAFAGLVALRATGEVDQLRLAVVTGGVVLTLGWTLLPLFFFGADPTLDPGRFATFAVPERALAAGLLFSGFVGLPGLATLVVGLGLFVASTATVGSTLVALVSVPLGLLGCVLLSRIVTALAASVLGSRRGRDVAGFGALALLVLLGPTIALASSGGVTAQVLTRVVDIAAWTPLGWAWAAPAHVAAGRWTAGLACLLLAAVWVLALFLGWERVLASVLRNPRTVSSQSGSARGLGLFARLPATPMGAIAARAGTYWVRDPRLNVPALTTMLLPAALLLPAITEDSVLALVGMPVVCGYLLGWSQHNDVGYDSTAFWMHVSSGVDGVSDRLGRLFPSAVMAAVALPVYAVLGPLLGSPWSLLPASLGVAIAFLLNGFGVACVTSAVKQYAVPAPGENPFTSRPGSAGLTLGVQAVCGAAVMALTVPALVLGVLAWFGHDWAAWAALVVGPGLGAVVLVVGVRLGADLFARRQAVLLQDLVSMR